MTLICIYFQIQHSRKRADVRKLVGKYNTNDLIFSLFTMLFKAFHSKGSRFYINTHCIPCTPKPSMGKKNEIPYGIHT